MASRWFLLLSATLFVMPIHAADSRLRKTFQSALAEPGGVIQIASDGWIYTDMAGTGDILEWNPNGELVRQITGCAGGIGDIAFNAAETKIFVCSGAGNPNNFCEFNRATGTRVLWPFVQNYGITRLKSRKDWVYYAYYERMVIWDSNTKSIYNSEYNGGVYYIESLMVNDTLGAYGGNNVGITLFWIPTGEVIRTIYVSYGMGNLVVLKASGNTIFAMTGQSLNIASYNIDTGEHVMTYGFPNWETQGRYDNIFPGAMDIYQEKFLFACYYATTEIYQFDIATGGVVHKYAGHEAVVYRLLIVNDTMFSTGADKKIRVWWIGDVSTTSFTSTSTSTRSSTSTSTGTSTSTFTAITTSRTTMEEQEVILLAQLPMQSTSNNNVATASLTSSDVGDASGAKVVAFDMFLLIIVVISCGLVCFALLIFAGCRINSVAKRNKHLEGLLRGEAPTSVTSTAVVSVPTVTVSSSMQSTLVGTYTGDISIPGFLEKSFGADFTTGRLVATGGTSLIYECSITDFELKTRVEDTATVVKVLNSKYAESSNGLTDAFMQDVSLLWALRNRADFVKVYAYTRSPLSMVMKRYNYGDFNEFISGKGNLSGVYSYSKMAIIEIMRQFCTGIAHLHFHDIVHLDIKPANLFIEVQDDKIVAVIGDLGISRILSVDSMKVKGFPVSNIRGISLYFAAPEMFGYFRHHDQLPPGVMKSADGFSLGMSVYSALVRKANKFYF